MSPDSSFSISSFVCIWCSGSGAVWQWGSGRDIWHRVPWCTEPCECDQPPCFCCSHHPPPTPPPPPCHQAPLRYIAMDIKAFQVCRLYAMLMHRNLLWFNIKSGKTFKPRSICIIMIPYWVYSLTVSKLARPIRPLGIAFFSYCFSYSLSFTCILLFLYQILFLLIMFMFTIVGTTLLLFDFNILYCWL